MLIVSLQKIGNSSQLVHGERAFKMELLLECRLMLSILLDSFIHGILGYISMSEKLRSPHPVL